MPKTTLNNFYRNYPYKCPDLTKGQGRNHIPMKDVICDHKYSIDLKTYKHIIKCSLEHLIQEYLSEGRRVNLPYALGYIELQRYKVKHWKSSGINWQETKKAGHYVYYSLNHTDGQRWLNKWKKNKRSFFCQHVWRIHLHKSVRKYISHKINKNPLLINKFNKK